MRLAFANEARIIVAREDAQDPTPYDASAFVAQAMSVKTARDFIQLLTDTPASFFVKYLSLMGHHEERPEDILCKGSELSFKGTVAAVLEKYFPEIEYADEFVINAGTLGPVDRDFKYVVRDNGEDREIPCTVIHPNGDYYIMYLSSIETFVHNIQGLARLAAVANGESRASELTRLDYGMPEGVVAIDSHLELWGEYNGIPAQQPPYESYFTQEVARSINDALSRHGVHEDVDGHILAPGHHGIYIYQSSFSDQEIAANIFTSFMNTLFEGSTENHFLGNTFKVDYDGTRFHVRDARNPLREMYREIADLAASNSIRLCANCGSPLLADKSRGNEAMYCSRSCNTKASSQRRETAYALAAAGVPLEEAVARIGRRYEQSIERWYQEAKALLD